MYLSLVMKDNAHSESTFAGATSNLMRPITLSTLHQPSPQFLFDFGLLTVIHVCHNSNDTGNLKSHASFLTFPKYCVIYPTPEFICTLPLTSGERVQINSGVG